VSCNWIVHRCRRNVATTWCAAASVWARPLCGCCGNGCWRDDWG